jgi:hypothetical protein
VIGCLEVGFSGPRQETQSRLVLSSSETTQLLCALRALSVAESLRVFLIAWLLDSQFQKLLVVFL